MEGTCPNIRDGVPCATPLDEAGACVTCDAAGEGLKLLLRSGFASVRELHGLLEERGLDAEMERVPATRPEERAHPLWNLYVVEADLARAREWLEKDWSSLLEAPEAVDAAARGREGVDLDAGGDITCPACGHVFRAAGAAAECPDCGLSLGAPSNAAPDESSTK